MRIENDGGIATGYHVTTMPNIEIATALIAFFGLIAAWFVVPAATRVHIELARETSETVATAA